MSIYQLVNSLCEELIKESDCKAINLNDAKKVAFEILLKKSVDREITIENAIKNLECTSFELLLKDKTRDACTLDEFICYIKDNSSLVPLSILLLNLKNFDEDQCKESANFFQLTSNNLLDVKNNTYFTQRTLLHESKSRNSQDESVNFLSSILESYVGKKSENISYDLQERLKLKPTNTSVNKEEVAKEETSNHRSEKKTNTWENLGERTEMSLSKNFASESASSYLLERLKKASEENIEIKAMSLQKVINSVKLLMIGIESEIFRRTDHTLMFHITDSVSCEGFSDMQSLYEGFIEMGTCYKRLKTYASKNPFNQNQIFDGFIFKAFCDCIVKFLYYCRDIIYTQEAETLLELYINTTKIREVIIHLSKFLKIHPSSSVNEVANPNGSDFLKLLHDEYTHIVNNDIKSCYVELLKKCCQVYFLRYQEWIYHGKLDDPYKELFIYYVDHYNINTKYFFDRAYLIKKSSVPSFLIYCADSVLLAGKYTMLLKSYNPMHPLFLMKKPTLRICITHEELAELRQKCSDFVKAAREECGASISIEEHLETKHREKLEKHKNAEIASRKNILKWKQEQEERLQEIREYRELQQKALCKELQNMEEKRLMRKLEEIQAEKNFMDEVEEIENERILKENAVLSDRIELYKKLNEELDQKIGKNELTLKNYGECLEKSTKSFSQATSEDILNANNPLEEDISQKIIKDDMNNVIEKSINLTDAQKNKIKVMSHEYNSLSIESEKNSNETSKILLTEAQKNKLKVMGHEFGMIEEEKLTPKIDIQDYDKEMTALQKNRLKVLSHEFGMKDEDLGPKKKKKSSNVMTDLERNRLKLMSHEFGYDDHDLNEPKKKNHPKLSLELLKPERTKEILESPMSVSSDHFNSDHNDSNEKLQNEVDNFEQEKDNETGENEIWRAFEEAVEKNFNTFLGISLDSENNYSTLSSQYENIPKMDSGVLAQFLQLSLTIPLNCYMNILNNETLKMFVKDLDILTHFKSLRNYFLLMDGEYSSCICHDMFSKLIKLKPIELLNYQSLHMILDCALSGSRNKDPNTERLSFIVQNIPEKFDIHSPNVLNMITLSYKLDWPLSLILNPETIEQYQAIFNYLMKLKRISWVLEECFQLLKDSHKEFGYKILKSQQYRNVQQIRHKMTQFVQSLENYITRNVLQISWNELMRDLKSSQSILCIYRKHTNYLKRILFLCLLNKKSYEFYKTIEDIFKVILKFHKHLKMKSWQTLSSTLVHQNYEKLAHDAADFDRLVKYTIYLSKKLINHGYQKEIYDLLQLIDINGFYSQA